MKNGANGRVTLQLTAEQEVAWPNHFSFDIDSE